jgi:hypothetical protein
MVSIQNNELSHDARAFGSRLKVHDVRAAAVASREPLARG